MVKADPVDVGAARADLEEPLLQPAPTKNSVNSLSPNIERVESSDSARLDLNIE